MSNLLRKIEFIKINRNGEVPKDMNWLKIIDSLLVNYGWIYSFEIHANDVAEKTDYFTMSKRGNPTLTYGSGLELYGFLHMNNIDRTISNIVKESPWASTEWIVTLQFLDGDNTDMYAQFFWDNKIVTRVEKDIYKVNELVKSPLKRPLEVVSYAEMVKKLKPSKNGQKTFMCLNKSVASIVESLSTSLKDDHHLLACLSKVNNKNPEELNKFIFNFNFNDDLGADTSFYFLYLMLKAGYPVSYEWDKNTIIVMLVIGKKKESEFSKQTNFPGFKEESIDGTAYCNGEPCPPLRRAYKDTLCLFFPSDIQEAIRDKYLTYIRDFIVHRFSMQD